MDMMDIFVVLLRAGIIEVKIKADLPADFFEKLANAVQDEVVNGVELADLIDALRKK